MTELRSALLDLRSAVDRALDALDERGSSSSSPRVMKPAEFAKSRGYSDRTIRNWCEEGMPHRGEGRARRILVVEADLWIAARPARRRRVA